MIELEENNQGLNKSNIKYLVKEIADYYEKKYPDALLETNKIDTLDYNLTKRYFAAELNLDYSSEQVLNPTYFSSCSFFYQENDFWKEKFLIILPVKGKPLDKINIFFNKYGKVDKYDISGDGLNMLPSKISKKNTTLTSLYKELKKYPEIFDYTQLEEVVTNYQNANNLRKKIIGQIVLRLIYNKNSTKNKGVIRAKQLIHDFNRFYSLNMDINDLKFLMKAEQKEQNTLQEIYDNYLIDYQITGQRPHPSILLALLLLPEKDNYKPLKVCEGEFYQYYKQEIDNHIHKVIQDFEITKNDIINYIEEAGIFYEEKNYEYDKIWFVFCEGFGAMHWARMYHPSYTPEQVYQYWFVENPRLEKPKQRHRTIERVRMQQRRKKNEY